MYKTVCKLSTAAGWLVFVVTSAVAQHTQLRGFEAVTCRHDHAVALIIQALLPGPHMPA